MSSLQRMMSTFSLLSSRDDVLDAGSAETDAGSDGGRPCRRRCRRRPWCGSRPRGRGSGISTVRSAISLTSDSKRRRTKFGWLRERRISGDRGPRSPRRRRRPGRGPPTFVSSVETRSRWCMTPSNFFRGRCRRRPARSAHRAGNDVAGAVLELVVDHLLLRLAGDDCIMVCFAVCAGDAAEVLRGDVDLELRTHVDAGTDAAGGEKCRFSRRDW